MSMKSRAARYGEARTLWVNYYRAVRVLRSLREIDPCGFVRFSHTWWAGRMRHENPAVWVRPEVVAMRKEHRLGAGRIRRLP